MAFLRKSVPLRQAGFGETVRELREQRGWTVDDLARLTGIHALVLTQLEGERLSELADPIFAERHVRRIAGALGASEAYLLAAYRRLLRKAPKADAPLMRVRSRRRDFFVPSQAIVVGLFLLVAGGIAGYVWWQANRLSAPPALVVERPGQGERLASPTVEIVGRTDAAVSLTLNGDAVPVGTDGRFSLRRDVPQGVTTLHFEARRRFGRIAALDTRVIYEPPATASSTPRQ